MVAFPLGSRGKSKYGLGKGLWLRLWQNVCPELETGPGRLGDRMSAVGKVGWEGTAKVKRINVAESGVRRC